MAYDEELAHRIRAALAGQPGLTEKRMFGGVGFMLHGNMACGVNRRDLIHKSLSLEDLPGLRFTAD